MRLPIANCQLPIADCKKMGVRAGFFLANGIIR